MSTTLPFVDVAVLSPVEEVPSFVMSTVANWSFQTDRVGVRVRIVVVSGSCRGHAGAERGRDQGDPADADGDTSDPSVHDALLSASGRSGASSACTTGTGAASAAPVRSAPAVSPAHDHGRGRRITGAIVTVRGRYPSPRERVHQRCRGPGRGPAAPGSSRKPSPRTVRTRHTPPTGSSSSFARNRRMWACRRLSSCGLAEPHAACCSACLVTRSPRPATSAASIRSSVGVRSRRSVPCQASKLRTSTTRSAHDTTSAPWPWWAMAVITVPTTSAAGASAPSSPSMPAATAWAPSPGTKPSTTMGAGDAARRAPMSASGSMSSPTAGSTTVAANS